MAEELSDLHIYNSQSFRELSIITKISQNILGTLSFEEVLQIISDGMAELLEIETSALYTIEEDNQLFLGATTPPLDPHMPKELRQAYISAHPHIQQAINTCACVYIENTQDANLSDAEKFVVELRNLKSLLFFPLLFEQKALGVLILGTCNDSKLYSNYQINLGQTVSNHLSVAIQNSKLHTELKNHKDNLEKVIFERTQDLELVNEELQANNEILFEKSEIIKTQNIELQNTLLHLKETQSHLIQSEKMASLGILTAGVAHEINNPLNYIMGALHGLQTHFTEYPSLNPVNTDFYLQSIQAGLERATSIVNSLNQFSRTNSGLDESCNIHSILENCLLILNNQLKHVITIEKYFETTNILIKGNAGKLHQVFINIITNAIQSITEVGTITIRTHTNTSHCFIEIQDSGCGISTENLSKITEPFFTTKNPGSGVGLGLSICYSIIKDHNGDIEFNSEIGKGTKVVITLPMLTE